MAEKVDRFDLKNSVFFGVITNMKKEYKDDCLDDDVLTYQATININSIKVKDHIKGDKMEKHKTLIENNIEMSTSSETLDEAIKKNEISTHAQFPESKIDIKQEYESTFRNEVFICETAIDTGNIENDPLEFSDMNIKIEEVKVDNIKTEFSPKYLFCNQCQEEYQDYCVKCQMLVHILNNANDKTQEEIPKNILEAVEAFGHTGIFALKVIPKGVQFGPFTGLNFSNCSWKIKEGKFVVTDDKSKCLNWMKYLDSAQNFSEQNLFGFQYENNLYYYSTREIQEGEELLMHFGEEYEDSLTKNVEVYFTPTTKAIIENVFACTFCCLGFSSKLHLIKHKTTCTYETNTNSSNEVLQIAQCTDCKIYLEEKEYLQYHVNNCHHKNSRDYLVPPPAVHMKKKRPSSLLNKYKRRQVKRYKCSQCKYQTAYKADLNNHSIKHYKGKAYSCGICDKRFERRENLKIHLTNLHVNVEKKAYQCSVCNFKTKYKSSLTVHILGKHSETEKYKCYKCDYQTSYKASIKGHLLSHEEVKRYNCSACAYATSHKRNMNKHINARHSETKKVETKKFETKEFETKKFNTKKFKCSKCEYQTTHRATLINHFHTHDEIKRFKCSECDFRANNKSYLELHKKQKHYEGRKYECSKCNFRTFCKFILKRHIDSHEKVKRFKCLECDYATHRKCDLKSHSYRHVQTKRFQCSECQYATNHIGSLNRHSRIHNKT